MNPQMKVQTLFGSTQDAQGWRARLPHVRVACVITPIGLTTQRYRPHRRRILLSVAAGDVVNSSS